MHKQGTHAASRGELIRAVHVRCSQRPSCRQTTRHNATHWLICPMKNEQAGLQSALCAPLNVSTSSHSLAVCPSLTMWPFAFLSHSFFLSFSSFCIPFYSSLLPSLSSQLAAQSFYLLRGTWQHPSYLVLQPRPCMISKTTCAETVINQSIRRWKGSQPLTLLIIFKCTVQF